jgi:GGDEF domain-containing protein
LGNSAFVCATASFGVASVPAQHPHPPASFEALIAAADEQLYAVKRSGRNGVRGTIATAPDALRSCA